MKIRSISNPLQLVNAAFQRRASRIFVRRSGIDGDQSPLGDSKTMGGLLKTTIVLFVSLAMAGCASWTPGQKRAAAIVAGVLVVGAAAAHRSDHGDSAQTGLPVGQPPGCTPQPNGSCR